ncbi:methyltransferase-like protein 27 [Salarias fasciatus]|uniref:methyltransferase-like protein 27 n=1 Tax=Salarias fasciatus TaxID=181472 RepID=UPI001176DAFF|nr:methyltransferase-like protein 27 [Salarias fasciatus]
MPRTFENARQVLHSVHKSEPVNEKLAFYNIWAETYDQDMSMMDFHSPQGAANSISTHFVGNRAEVDVLDVACGTGRVAVHLMADGFKSFVGIDGSTAMLEKARKLGIYQDLKQCILGVQPLPVEKESFDVVVIAGALSVGHVPVSVIRELCDVCKPGGYVCMTSRDGADNLQYKADLEHEIERMEEERLWTKVAVTLVENWEKATSGTGYISGAAYVYKKI